MKIIDAHVHLIKTEKIDLFYNTPDDYFEKHWGQGIEKIIAMPNVSSTFSFRELNEKLFLYDKDNRIACFYMVNPLCGTDVLFSDFFSPKGLKIHPSVSQLPVNHFLFDKYFDYAEQNNIPVIVHCGRNEISRIDYLISRAMEHSNVKIIAAHFGGNSYDLSIVAVNKIRKLENVSVDTSNGKHPILVELAVDVLGEDRVIFGSDEPYADFFIQLQCILCAKLSDRIKEKILYENITKLVSFNK